MQYTSLFAKEVSELLRAPPSVPGAPQITSGGDTAATAEAESEATAAKQLELLQRQLNRLASEKATAAAAQGAVEAAHSEEISADASGNSTNLSDAAAAGGTEEGAGDVYVENGADVESSSDESSADELDALDLTRTAAEAKALGAVDSSAAAAAASGGGGAEGAEDNTAIMRRNLKQVLVHFQPTAVGSRQSTGAAAAVVPPSSHEEEGEGRPEEKPWFAVYRAILPSMGEGDVVAEVAALPKQKRWAYFMLRGGHFAGAIFQGEKVTVHKCFHKYVVRAKRGTVQSAQDGKSGTKQPKSAGANIRRYNEVALNNDVQSLVAGWTSQLASCDIIFLQAPVRSRKTFYNSPESGGRLEKGDPRIRSVPFTTGRPVLRELQRIHTILSAVYHVDTPDLSASVDGEDAPDAEALAAAAAQKAAASAARKEAIAAQAAAAVAVPDAKFSNSPLYMACLAGDLEAVATVIADTDRQGGFDLDFAWNEGAETAMHAASRGGAADIVALLLEKGACPSFLDQHGRPPFVVAGNKDARNAFRRFMAENPGRWNYAAAQIPSALTAEMEEKQEAKAKEQKKREKERKKIRDKAKAEAAAHAAAEKVVADAEAAEERAAREAARQAAKAEKAKLARLTPRDLAAAAALARFEKKQPNKKELVEAATLESNGSWASKGAKGIDIKSGWDERSRFGPSSAAGAAAGGGGTAAAAAPAASAPASAPASTLVTVKLVGMRPGAKLKLIKELKKVLPKLGLAAAKKFAETLPQTVKKDLSPEEAKELRIALEGAGGKVKVELQE